MRLTPLPYPMGSHTTSTLLLLLSSLTTSSAASSPSSSSSSKRGISIISDLHAPDWSLLGQSSISWYWNWSPYPGDPSLISNFTFVPQIHGLDNIEADVAQVKALPQSSKHLMTFNEPDGATSTGGTGISADDAARAYIEHIVPLRNGGGDKGGRFLISHPATTGSQQGLEWLSDFNASCWEVAPETGCPQDFVTAHWYGDFAGLKGWVGQLDDFYNGNGTNGTGQRLKIWISELAIPQVDEDATIEMMNQSLSYLDASDVVERYSWFGMFRADDSNEWTGENVALFDKKGGLTELGAEYLNSEGNVTFEEGQKGIGGAGSVGVGRILGLALCLGSMWTASL